MIIFNKGTTQGASTDPSLNIQISLTIHYLVNG